jgi:hypothetical protein
MWELGIQGEWRTSSKHLGRMYIGVKDLGGYRSYESLEHV